MPADSASISTGPEEVVLERCGLRAEIALRPFSFTVRRSGRRLLRTGGAWVAEGTIKDQFVQFTEGLPASEELQPAEPALHARLVERVPDGVSLALSMHGGRQATMRIELGDHERIQLQLEASGDPLRLALHWDRRSEERLVGLGLRHHTRFDQSGRSIQLGADRRYTGPDCPPEMLAEGGIPQGGCAPLPWLVSSRGYAVWCQSDANGIRFELGGERISVSARAQAGPLRWFCSAPPRRLPGCGRSVG